MEPALDVALACLRNPSLLDAARGRALPGDMLPLLRLAAGDQALAAELAQSTHRSSREIVDAAIFFVHQVLFDPGADSYRTLGARPDAADAQIKEHYRWLVRWQHPDRAKDVWDGVYAERVNRAWQDLRTPERRRAYDERSARGPAPAAAAAETPRRPEPAPRWQPVDDAPMQVPGRWARQLPVIVLGTLAFVGLGLLVLIWSARPRGLPDDDSPAATRAPIDAADRSARIAAAEAEAAAAVAVEGADEGMARRPTPATLAGPLPVDSGAGDGLVPDGFEAAGVPAPEPVGAVDPMAADATRADAEPAAPESAEPDFAEFARAEAARVAAARAEAERVEAERTEAARIEAARVDAARIDAERAEAERAEAERARAARAESARAEATRAAATRAEAATADAARVEAPRAASSPPPPASAPSPLPIDRLAGEGVLHRLSRAYVAGDLPALLRLFTRDARNNRGGLDAIAEDYRKLFDASKERELSLDPSGWVEHGDEATLLARYRARVRSGGSWGGYSDGWIRFDLRREDGELKISRMTHERDS